MTYRPGYLAHVRVLPVTGGHLGTWRVVLASTGRPLLPAHVQARLDAAGVDVWQDVALGLVAPRAVEGDGGEIVPLSYLPDRSTATGRKVLSWGFNCHGHPDDGGSGAYETRRAAAESCAVKAIEGSRAHQRFDTARDRRRRRPRVSRPMATAPPRRSDGGPG